MEFPSSVTHLDFRRRHASHGRDRLTAAAAAAAAASGCEARLWCLDGPAAAAESLLEAVITLAILNWQWGAEDWHGRGGQKMLPLPPCTRREPAHHRSLLQQHGEDTVVISECSERQLESDHVVAHVAQWKLPPLVRPLLARRYDAVQWSRMCLQKVVAPWSAHHLQTPAPAWHLPALPSTLPT